MARPLPHRWQPVDVPVTPTFAEARVVAHHALQLAAVPGTSMLPAADDGSHTNLSWRPGKRAFAGRRIPRNRPFRASLEVPTLTLALVDTDDQRIGALPLAGHTRAQALDWLALAIQEHTGQPLGTSLCLPALGLPDHPVADGAPFPQPDPHALDQLALWFGNADELLRALRPVLAAAGEVRCWPEHFDLATLVRLDGPKADPETARSVAVGLSPGDEHFDEPYLYVLPWPPPNLLHRSIPTLAGGGGWHFEGWVGPALPASSLLPQAQAEQIDAFIESALIACMHLLGA
ncbi:MAG: hypothetical protein H6739_14830 [Alphaproteobacteria bacterium]|nr:hypothetical protein [Alphaproteobacteria bacterium]